MSHNYKRWYDHDPVLLEVINLLQKYFNDKNDYYDPAVTAYVEDEFNKDILEQIKEQVLNVL